MPKPRTVSDSDLLRSDAGFVDSDDDIELPPVSESPDDDDGRYLGAKPPHVVPDGLTSVLIGTIAVVAAITVGTWMMSGGRSSEQHHPNWQHVTTANDSSSDRGNLVLVESGIAQPLPAIHLNYRDADRATSRSVRSALLKHDVAKATVAMHAAQQISAAIRSDVTIADLVANSHLVQALRGRRQEFFKLQISDCCDEDGDVVEILINGSSFATIPLTNAGMTLSVPLLRGKNMLTLRGIKDGSGGITVSFQSSQGNYYSRSMKVGQEYQMGVVVR
jgi:hypothetical protein